MDGDISNAQDSFCLTDNSILTGIFVGIATRGDWNPNHRQDNEPLIDCRPQDLLEYDVRWDTGHRDTMLLDRVMQNFVVPSPQIHNCQDAHATPGNPEFALVGAKSYRNGQPLEVWTVFVCTKFGNDWRIWDPDRETPPITRNSWPPLREALYHTFVYTRSINQQINVNVEQQANSIDHYFLKAIISIEPGRHHQQDRVSFGVSPTVNAGRTEFEYCTQLRIGQWDHMWTPCESASRYYIAMH